MASAAFAQPRRVSVERPACAALAQSHEALVSALELELGGAGLTTLGEDPAVHRIHYDTTPCVPAPRRLLLTIDDGAPISVDLEAAAARARERSLALLIAELLHEVMVPATEDDALDQSADPLEASREFATADTLASTSAPPNLISSALALGVPAAGVAAVEDISSTDDGAEDSRPTFRVAAVAEIRGHSQGGAYGVGARASFRVRPRALPNLALVADFGGYRANTYFGAVLATVTVGTAIGPAFDVGPVELFFGPRIEIGGSFWRNSEDEQFFEWYEETNPLLVEAGLSARATLDLVGRLALVVGVDLGGTLRAPRYTWVPSCPIEIPAGECFDEPTEESTGLGGLYWNVQVGFVL